MLAGQLTMPAQLPLAGFLPFSQLGTLLPPPSALALPACSEGAADGSVTSRARGTDCFKSPEMLLVGGAAQREQRDGDQSNHGIPPGISIPR